MSIIISITIMFAMLLGAKYFFNMDQEIRDGKLPIALTYSGFILALFLGISGTLNFTFHDVTLISISLDIINSIIVFILLVTSMTLTNRILFNLKNISEYNTSVGIFNFFFLISTGIIMFGSTSGEGSLISMILFFSLGQIFLILITFAYSFIYSKIINNIRDGGITQSILVGGTLLAYSIIISASIIGDSTTLISDLKEFVLYAILGIILLLGFVNKIIDRLFLPLSEIQDEFNSQNIGAIILVISFKLGYAIIIAINL